MARAWFTSWLAFSSSVIRCTRSAARCSGGRLVSRYAGFCASCPAAGHAITPPIKPTTTIRNPRLFITSISDRQRCFEEFENENKPARPTAANHTAARYLCQAKEYRDSPLENRFISYSSCYRFSRQRVTVSHFRSLELRHGCNLLAQRPVRINEGGKGNAGRREQRPE